MSIHIGINGFGRIGKLVFRLMQEDPAFEVVGINDTADIKTLAHLLKYDSAHGAFNGSVEVKGENLLVNGKSINIYHENLPANIPRTMHGADIVIESSGMFLTREILAGHLESGAKKVILTCPPQDPLDKTIIIGINENSLTEKDNIISNASCTANSVAPMLKVLHENFGVVQAFMNTVHPATNNQRLIDAPHKDLRRSRTALTNIIPTTSTAIPIVIELMPYLKEKFDGLATRVPVEDGSLIEITAQLNSKVTLEEINKAFYDASVGQLKNIIQYCSDPIVSSDVIGNSHSLVFDSLLTKVLSGNFIQVIGWYDNEYGYSNRVVDLAKLIG
ncbi:MAG: type I glyceraldehyde-3-phosphate dehydrogenase [Bacteroidota bacterium]